MQLSTVMPDFGIVMVVALMSAGITFAAGAACSGAGAAFTSSAVEAVLPPAVNAEISSPFLPITATGERTGTSSPSSQSSARISPDASAA